MSKSQGEQPCALLIAALFIGVERRMEDGFERYKWQLSCSILG
jgi:hypothetical protein